MRRTACRYAAFCCVFCSTAYVKIAAKHAVPQKAGVEPRDARRAYRERKRTICAVSFAPGQNRAAARFVPRPPVFHGAAVKKNAAVLRQRLGVHVKFSGCSFTAAGLFPKPPARPFARPLQTRRLSGKERLQWSCRRESRRDRSVPAGALCFQAAVLRCQAHFAR